MNDSMRDQWQFKPGVIYLNHGSFGPSPLPVRSAQQAWRDRLESEPMDFFVREQEQLLIDARAKLAPFVGVGTNDLVFTENSTYAMNIVAASVELQAGDEVLLNDHEYGAILRIWERVCQRSGATVKQISLSVPFQSREEIVAAFDREFTKKTRLVVVSHITSPTAVIIPVADICALAREHGALSCVDGPHAIATLPLDLARIDCDYYTASCHKWLSAPFGSGFLYVHPRQQETIQTPILSWGRLLPEMPRKWNEEFNWVGTRDPSAYLAVTAAIDFMEAVPLSAFRDYAHELAGYARRRISELTGLDALVPDCPSWYGPMITMPLPDCARDDWQTTLRQRFGIEIPVIRWRDKLFIRVSCHLYTTRTEIDKLVDALADLISSTD